MSQIPESPYLSRLVEGMKSASTPVEAACLRVERAGFLARQGFFEEAGSEIDAVRTQFARQSNPSVTVWLCIAEAWMAHFRTLDGVVAHDKMKRALALSSAMNLSKLQALSAAWLAHFDFVRDDMEEMAKNLSLALKLADPGNHAAQARIGMVAAIAFDYARRRDFAKPWYAHTRAHAILENDEATMSALNYNMAGNYCIHLFQASIFGEDIQDAAAFASFSAEAAKNFDDWFGAKAQSAFVQMLRAMIASARENYLAALQLYLAYRTQAEEQGHGHMRATYLADIAWCRYNSGDKAGAERDATAAVGAIRLGMFDEDLAEAHGRLFQVFRCLEDNESAAMHFSLANEARARNRLNQEKLLSLLCKIHNV